MSDKSKIGLGTVQFGLSYGISNSTGQTKSSEVRAILDTAKKNKIETIDCASGYGNAEQVVGNFDLFSFKVVSKFLPPDSDNSVEEQFVKTLEDLKISSLYGYLAHRPLEIIKSPEQWDYLKGLKEDGKVAKIGFSLNEPEELEELLRNGYFPDLVQVPFNYLDRRFEEQMKSLRCKGCEIHTRSVFLQGLFFVEPPLLNGHFSEVKPILNKLRNNSVNLAGDLLNFVVQQPFVDTVIIGVETEAQLIQNIKELDSARSLPELEKRISDKILNPSRWPKN